MDPFIINELRSRYSIFKFNHSDTFGAWSIVKSKMRYDPYTALIIKGAEGRVLHFHDTVVKLATSMTVVYHLTLIMSNEIENSKSCTMQ